MKKLMAVALVILGTVVLIYGGISYNRQRTILDVGGMKATVTEHKSVPIAPVIGVISLIGGVVLLVTGRRAA
jgi:hypothetical protein